MSHFIYHKFTFLKANSAITFYAIDNSMFKSQAPSLDTHKNMIKKKKKLNTIAVHNTSLRLHCEVFSYYAVLKVLWNMCMITVRGKEVFWFYF